MSGHHRITSKPTAPTTLQIARTLPGLTQSDLALLAGVNRATVGELESGRGRTPTLTTATALAAALNYDVGSLFPEHFTPRPAGPVSAGHDAPTPAAPLGVPAAGVPSATEGER